MIWSQLNTCWTQRGCPSDEPNVQTQPWGQSSRTSQVSAQLPLTRQTFWPGRQQEPAQVVPGHAVVVVVEVGVVVVVVVVVVGPGVVVVVG